MAEEKNNKSKKDLTIFSRVAVICGMVVLALSLAGSYALELNWNLLPEESRGPYNNIARFGEWFTVLGFYGGLVGLLVAIVASVVGIFRKPRGINIVASCLGLLMAYLSLSTALGTFQRIRQAPIRLYTYNLRTLAGILEKYAAQNEGLLPQDANWCEILVEFDSNSMQAMINKPVRNKAGISEIAFNANLTGVKLAELPGDVVLLFETNVARNPVGGQELINAGNHPAKGCFVLLGNMHIEFVKQEDFDKLRWKP